MSNGSLERLKSRRQFLRVAQGRCWVTRGFVLRAAPRPAAGSGSHRQARIGCTVSKKVGNAVERNRVRRRLKALSATVVPELGAANMDYVLVGRRAALTLPFSRLLDDLKGALIKLSQSSGPDATRRTRP